MPTPSPDPVYLVTLIYTYTGFLYNGAIHSRAHALSGSSALKSVDTDEAERSCQGVTESLLYFDLDSVEHTMDEK